MNYFNLIHDHRGGLNLPCFYNVDVLLEGAFTYHERRAVNK